MWKRSETDRRRVKIVDFQHLAYSYMNGGAPKLSTTLTIDGVPTILDTTIPAYSLKWLHNLSDYGFNPIIVCFDSKGSSLSRKAYFERFKVEVDGDAPLTIDGYKAHRESSNNDFYEGINKTAYYLQKAKVPIAKCLGYEADDLVFASIQRAKEQYPDLPIDVYTGDADLIPLVDEQVSVFLRSRTTTYAVSKDIEKKHYVQLTPESYATYVNNLTVFKTIDTPYNSVLLAKLLRGDKSDLICAKKDWKPKKYNELLYTLVADGYDIGNLFRYGAYKKELWYRDTCQPIPEHLIDSTPKENKIIHFGEPEELTHMCEVLSHYVEPIDIIHIKHVYHGINLNACYKVGNNPGEVPDMFKRRPAEISADIKGYDQILLAQAAAELQIKIPIK